MSTTQQRLSPTAKRVILIGVFTGALILLYTVRSILPPFILAVVVAYVLNPLVETLVRLTRRSRTTVVAAIYIVLVVGLVLTIIMVTPTLVRQVQAVNIDLEAIGDQIRQLLADYQRIEIGGFSIDLLALSGEIRGALESIVSFLAARTGGIVVGVVSGLVWIVLVLLVSFYLLKDAPGFRQFIHDALPVGYQPDMRRLAGEVNAVLSAYLRGQLMLSLVVGLVTGIALAIVGVRNALLLGVVAGALEVIPSLGPVLASVPAIAIALFQGSANLDIENHWFALLVIGLYLVIQQLESHLLAPRIIGSSVNLHPVVVIFAALSGASIAGLLGVFLAVPVVAVGRIVAVYVYQKLRE
jgi:predicted PurR-regulated permease PerM